MGRIRPVRGQLTTICKHFAFCRKFAKIIAKNMQSGFLGDIHPVPLTLHRQLTLFV
jgi:hypothetical protein